MSFESIIPLILVATGAYFLGREMTKSEAEHVAMTRHSHMFSTIISEIEEHMTPPCREEFTKIRKAYYKRYNIEDYK